MNFLVGLLLLAAAPTPAPAPVAHKAPATAPAPKHNDKDFSDVKLPQGRYGILADVSPHAVYVDSMGQIEIIA